MQIFDFQDVKIGKNEWNGHDDPAMMGKSWLKNFLSIGQARFFSFDLSSAANCRATSVAALAICMPKNRSNVSLCRLRAAILPTPKCCFWLPKLPSMTVARRLPMIRRAVEISAGSSLGLGHLRTKLVMMPFSVQMRKLKTTKFISFSPCLVWAESVSTFCGPASCCGRRSDGPLHLPCDPKAASCRHHRLRMTGRIAVGDFRLRRPCTGLRPTFAQPRLAKLTY